MTQERDAELDRLDAIPDPLAARREEPPAPVAAPPAERSATRREAWAVRALALGLAVAWLVAKVLLVGVDRIRGRAMPGALAWLALALVAFALALWPGRRGLGAPRPRLVAAAALAPIAFVAIAAALGDAGPLLDPHLLPCLGGVAADVGVPLVLAVLAMRRAFPASAAARGALLGAGAGLLGAASVGMLCPVETRMHLVLAHGAPVAVAVVLGALLGSRFDRA